MKKVLVLLLLICLAAAVIVVAGCGGDEAKVEEQADGGTGEEGTVQLPEGELTIEDAEKTDEGGKVTVEGEGGDEATIEYSTEAPTEEELGAPVYPNATYEPDSGVMADVTTEDSDFSGTMAEFHTTDSLENVVRWYEDRLGKPMESTPDGTVWMFGDPEEDMVMVSVADDGDRVVIVIARLAGMSAGQ